jgi:hypothetical protein
MTHLRKDMRKTATIQSGLCSAASQSYIKAGVCCAASAFLLRSIDRFGARRNGFAPLQGPPSDLTRVTERARNGAKQRWISGA